MCWWRAFRQALSWLAWTIHTSPRWCPGSQEDRNTLCYCWSLKRSRADFAMRLLQIVPSINKSGRAGASDHTWEQAQHIDVATNKCARHLSRGHVVASPSKEEFLRVSYPVWQMSQMWLQVHVSALRTNVPSIFNEHSTTSLHLVWLSRRRLIRMEFVVYFSRKFPSLTVSL